MAILHVEHKAIDLSQGFPNFQADEQIKVIGNEAINIGHNQYAPMQGYYGLREVISDKIETLHNRSITLKVK